MNSRSPFSKSVSLLSPPRKVAKCFLKKSSDLIAAAKAGEFIFGSGRSIVIAARRKLVLPGNPISAGVI
jgi:hypothetical protein